MPQIPKTWDYPSLIEYMSGETGTLESDKRYELRRGIVRCHYLPNICGDGWVTVEYRGKPIADVAKDHVVLYIDFSKFDEGYKRWLNRVLRNTDWRVITRLREHYLLHVPTQDMSPLQGLHTINTVSR